MSFDSSLPPLPALIDALEQLAVWAEPILCSPELADKWTAPSALDGYTVGGLVGHLYTALQRVEDALDEPIPEPHVVVDLARFYGANRVDDTRQLQEGIHAAVRSVGHEVAALGPALSAEVPLLCTSLVRRLRTEDGSRVVPVLQVADGVARLDAYVSTRLVELAVHTDDIAVSCDLAVPQPPTDAAGIVLALVLGLARVHSGDIAVLRAFARAERAQPDAIRVL